MDHLKPEKVLEAYLSICFKPCRKRYIDTANKQCCGLAAADIYKEKINVAGMTDAELKHAMISRLFVDNEMFRVGFVDGFDGRENWRQDNQEYTSGHETGRAAWKLVYNYFKKDNKQ